ncbi:hypothetical protein GW17_00033956 [Ensete ventricosum]|nr:hypothetical protein GW17_00033956 [Ensete ventricosum]
MTRLGSVALRIVRSDPVAFQNPRSVLRLGRPPLRLFRSLGTKKYHSLSPILANPEANQHDIMTSDLLAELYQWVGRRTWELPGVMAIDVEDANDVKAAALAGSDLPEIEIQELLLRWMESETRELKFQDCSRHRFLTLLLLRFSATVN